MASSYDTDFGRKTCNASPFCHPETASPDYAHSGQLILVVYRASSPGGPEFLSGSGERLSISIGLEQSVPIDFPSALQVLGVTAKEVNELLHKTIKIRLLRSFCSSIWLRL
jgi:hypothetical protein